MCGRDAAFYTWKDIHAFSQPLVLRTPADDPPATYNRAPTQTAWVIGADEGGGGLAFPARWGLLPPWAKDTRLAYRTINARLETVATSAAFRGAWKARRALVPSSGYYEWMRLEDRSKQPFFIRLRDAPVMFYAGLWERRRDDAGNELMTYSVLTRDADQSVATLHDRMPLILPATAFGRWLHGDPHEAMAIAMSVPPAPLVFHRVDRAVGNVRNDRPELVAPLPPHG